MPECSLTSRSEYIQSYDAFPSAKFRGKRKKKKK